MDQEWQGRAVRLRAQGHTLVFIAAQICRLYRVAEPVVLAFLTRVEREREMRKGREDDDR